MVISFGQYMSRPVINFGKGCNPDRFLKNGMLNPNILDPRDVAFGFGRRVCPGTGIDTLWVAIVTVLACTEICLGKDGAGREIEVEGEFLSSLVTEREPQPFSCCVRFRSEAHAALLMEQM